MQERTVTDVAVASGMTVVELHAIPEDGQRRELIDGELFVTPAPMPGHQGVQVKLLVALLDVAETRRVLAAPVDIQVDASTCVQPDIVVFSLADSALLAADAPPPIGMAPEIAVEISSPSTRRIDLIHKRRLFARAGVREYWFVDRDVEVVDVYAFGEDDDLRSASGDEQIPSGVAVPTISVAKLLSW